MKNFIKQDPWCIIEENFHPEFNRITESLCSLGNGRMGQRANFEEFYSGDTHQGNYVAGVYFPDKTRVGWWKNGYPEYFAKVLNAANWIGINIDIDNETLDLAKCTIKEFARTLNMKEGLLERSFTATLPSGRILKVNSKRFLSIIDSEIGAIQYAITPLNFSASITVTPYIDADVMNEDSNYDEKFWDEVKKECLENEAYLVVKTKKLDFHVCTGMQFDICQNEKKLDLIPVKIEKTKYVANKIAIPCKENETTILYKYAANLSSENHEKKDLIFLCKETLSKAHQKGFKTLLKEQKDAWAKKWTESDIVIEGDVAAQQGIRFNIFQLNQTYTGEDERLNIGPKGFTGEKYGGSTYWDTEAYCIPFYLATTDESVSKNLLLYRYKQLDKAIKNAIKLGFKNGAALFPMVTMNGEECHNEWEITFEEIHRNGAIAYAIYNYTCYTDDKNYLITHGLEVLLAIARFWSQRITYSEHKKQYVMLGVTGPNEYENNVNNNWYTSMLACWCMNYAMKAIDFVKENAADQYNTLINKIHFDENSETEKWKTIINNMYLGENTDLNIFLQQDGYLDKEQILVKDLDSSQLPLNQKWSWDRILRSCYIKQADVLQGIYFFEEQFDQTTIKSNYDFYEPRTVHESSLSPCVHAILAAKLGYHDKAYEFYLRTARLDLDDYNNDTKDGCHITSMAGTWMSIVQGFGGMRVHDNHCKFSPFIPEQWQSYAFKVRFKGTLLKIKVTKKEIVIENQSDNPITLKVFDKTYTIEEILNLNFS